MNHLTATQMQGLGLPRSQIQAANGLSAGQCATPKMGELPQATLALCEVVERLEKSLYALAEKAQPVCRENSPTNQQACEPSPIFNSSSATSIQNQVAKLNQLERAVYDIIDRMET